MEFEVTHKQQSLKWKILLPTFIVILLTFTFASHFRLEESMHTVILNDNGIEAEITTFDDTVESFLQNNSIFLNEYDEITPEKYALISEGMRISIRRANKMTVFSDGVEHNVHFIEGDVKYALDKLGIRISNSDVINFGLEERLFPGMFVNIIRVTKETVIKSEAIPYQILVREDNTRARTSRRILQEGLQGELTRTYEVVYKDGVKYSEKFIKEEIVRNSVDHIVLAGTLGTMTTSRGETVRYAFSREFRATAYTHTGNPTRTGVMPKVGHVAVDPRVIPLNSTIYVDFPRGWNHLDGFYKATDTGSAIRGNIIDIFMDTEEEAINFGRRRVEVFLVR